MRALLAALPVLALAASLPVALPAGAATLRPFSQVEGGTVRLSDLWDGVEADKALGPAPAPGARITVEAPQLLAIARQFGVDWRPASPADRALLERPGKPLPREDVMDALRTALRGAGVSRDAEIELPGYSAPMVPSAKPVRPTVSQLDYDAATGRFSGLVQAAADGAPPVTARVTGRVVEMLEVAVPVRRISPGTVLTAADLRMARVRTAQTMGEVVRLPEQAVGLALKQTGVPGQPIPATDLVRPLVVAKGAQVRMTLDAGPVALTANGVAVEGGAMGERIRILNPASRAVVEAEVIGPDQVRVAPGSTPLAAPARVASR